MTTLASAAQVAARAGGDRVGPGIAAWANLRHQLRPGDFNPDALETSQDSGVIYKLTLGGKLTVIHAFDRIGRFAEGYRATAGLLEATDGFLYGSMQYGGDPACGPGGNGCGVLFKITKSGNYTVLHTFHSAEPAQPQATQIQHTNGKIYGLLNGPNFSDGGAIYSLDVGLKPFVKLMTRSGKAGQKVQLLGQSVAEATRVKFGTGSASFEAVSDKFLTALVPVGGTTGSVTVTTPSGTLTSSNKFKVIPTLTTFDPVSAQVGSQVVINGTGLHKHRRSLLAACQQQPLPLNLVY